ncbi:MAG: ketosteroid isomerase family protein [Xenococcus sp. (in: cyanobacteria)]
MVQTKINDSSSLQCEEFAIRSYFSTLNQGKFKLTAALFSDKGQLVPPFDSPVIGQQAITDYLQQEAIDMKFQPRSATDQVLPNGQTDVEVRGQVSTSLFTVNVVWNFLISSQGKIDLVKVNLIASMQELLRINPQGWQEI